MVYRSSAEKAEDNHSSGIMLITIGALGIIGDIIFYIYNPLDMPVFNKYLSCGVMGALFVLFFVMGIFSVKTYKIFSEKAKEENTMLDQVKSWCTENLTKGAIEEGVKFSEDYEFEVDSEDDPYFARCEYIKDRIQSQFMNVDEDLLDAFIDEYYTGLYGDEN